MGTQKKPEAQLTYDDLFDPEDPAPREFDIEKYERERGDAIINEKDFQSIRVGVNISNETSGMGIHKGIRTFLSTEGNARVKDPKQKAPLTLTLIDFPDVKDVTLDVPKNTAQKGHSVVVEFDVETPQEAFRVAFNGKVRSHESATPLQDRIVVTFSKLNLADWERFRGTFSNRQTEIEAFFRAVKGK